MTLFYTLRDHQVVSGHPFSSVLASLIFICYLEPTSLPKKFKVYLPSMSALGGLADGRASNYNFI